MKYEVLNFGGMGYSPSLYPFFIKRDIVKYKPNMIIMEIELLNDTSDEAYVKTGGVDSYGLPTKIERARYYPNWLLMPPISSDAHLWERLYIRKLKLDITRRLNVLGQRYFPNPVFSQYSDTYYYNYNFDQFFLTQKRLDHAFKQMFVVFRGIDSFLKDRDIKFLILIYPSQYMFTDTQYKPGAERLYAKAMKKVGDLGIKHIGLAEPLKNNGGAGLFIDFCHPNGWGNKVVTDVLYEYLKTNL